MSRVIALDYGEKKTGVAETDPYQLIASGLCTIATSELMNFLIDYFAKETVETLVIGLSKDLKNQLNPIESNIALFITEFEKRNFGIKIERVDERFTSKMAFQTMIDGGLKKKKRRNKEIVDKISATLILQSYLERK